jgi:hypothetical protein
MAGLRLPIWFFFGKSTTEAVSATLAGIEATSAVGTVTVSGKATVTLAGAGATSAAGAAVTGTIVSLDGVGAVAYTGNLIALPMGYTSGARRIVGVGRENVVSVGSARAVSINRMRRVTVSRSTGRRRA